MKSSKQEHLPLIGWREYVALPDLGISAVKAKIDTGARSSALHAFDIEMFQQQGKTMVRFKVHPNQRDRTETAIAQAELIDLRRVRNSGGQDQLRPVIQTSVELHGQQWLIEVTLTNRDMMGFRMLLGRQAVRKRFLVDAGRSYLQSRSGNRKLKKKRLEN